MRPDVIVENHGSIFAFQPITPAGRDWIAEHVESEPWQWLGGALCVDQRFAADLAEGMAEDGLVLE